MTFCDDFLRPWCWVAVGLFWSVAQAETAVLAPAPVPLLSVPLAYQSPLHAYQPHADAQLHAWPEANERVRQIGGWRAYAKEAAGVGPAPVKQTPEPHAGHPSGSRP